jgi:kynurenine formamidase
MSTDAIRPNNWGRWGDTDERGAANHQTPDVVKAGAGLVRQGKVYSLALPLRTQKVPVFPRRTPPMHFMTLDGGDYAAGFERKGGFQSADDYIIVGTHATTHVDALAHIWYGDQLYNGFSGNTIRSNGAERCGIDKIRSLVGRGVMLDLCKHKGVDRLEKSYAITPDDMVACAAAQGVEMRPGDVLLLRTGWLKTFYDQGSQAFFATEPGIGIDAAQWIANMDFAAVGADNYGVEVVPTEDGQPGIPVHTRLIRDYGVYLMELFDLEELARDQVYEFLFVAAPLMITGGVGSPLNPLAIA